MKLITPHTQNWLALTPGVPWASGPLASFDLETTSTDPLTAKLVSAAIVIDVPGISLETRSWLVQTDIPLEATAVHGISTEYAMTHGVSLTKAVPEIITALENLSMPVCVCNGTFDFTILDHETRRAGYADGFTPCFQLVDSLVCDRALDPYRRGRRTLTATLAAYGKAIRGATPGRV